MPFACGSGHGGQASRIDGPGVTAVPGGLPLLRGHRIRRTISLVNAGRSGGHLDVTRFRSTTTGASSHSPPARRTSCGDSVVPVGGKAPSAHHVGGSQQPGSMADCRRWSVRREERPGDRLGFGDVADGGRGAVGRPTGHQEEVVLVRTGVRDEQIGRYPISMLPADHVHGRGRDVREAAHFQETEVRHDPFEIPKLVRRQHECADSECAGAGIDIGEVHVTEARWEARSPLGAVRCGAVRCVQCPRVSDRTARFLGPAMHQSTAWTLTALTPCPVINWS